MANNMKTIKSTSFATALLAASLCMTSCDAPEKNAPAPSSEVAPSAVKVQVTDKNFIRAESDVQMTKYVKAFGSFGKFHHNRALYDLTNQITIRPNLDTIYSFAIFDLNSPVEITMPKAGDKYQSLMLISQDHSISSFYEGTHTITKESTGTRYAMVVVRTFVDPADKASLAGAHKLQDAVVLKQDDIGKFDVPMYDEESLTTVRASINAEANKLPTTRGFFGDINELDPKLHMYGAAYGWGGLPEKDAIYEGVTVDKNDGKTAYSVIIKDVPVDGFWSISVYDKDGKFVINDDGVNTKNSLTADKNTDGTVTVNFGNKATVNNIEIMDGWNYLIRLYQPKKAILDGEWSFPKPVQSK